MAGGDLSRQDPRDDQGRQYPVEAPPLRHHGARLGRDDRAQSTESQDYDYRLVVINYTQVWRVICLLQRHC